VRKLSVVPLRWLILLAQGFVEKIYANALKKELRRQALAVKQEHPVKVYYNNDLVGEFFLRPID
jgi:GxxExxY protein